MLTVVALSWGIMEVLRPDQNCMASLTWLHLNILTLMALDHEFRFFKIVTLQVIDINAPICFLFGHHGSICPCKEILRALVCWNLRIQWTQFKTIEFWVDHDWWVTFNWGLLLEACFYTNCGLVEFAIRIYFYLIRLFLWTTIRNKS